MTRCPECSGQLRPIGADFFCLDCDFDTLQSVKNGGVATTASVYPPPRRQRPRNRTPQWIDTDAEWYMKTQLRRYRKWRDEDFARVQPDYIGTGYYTTNYFYASTVEKHENTDFFRASPRRQTPLPEDVKINELAYHLTVRGEDLIKAGWTAEMIDQLPQFVAHKWRRKRKFGLCDLSKVSPKFHVGPQVIEIKKHRPRSYRTGYYM